MLLLLVYATTLTVTFRDMWHVSNAQASIFASRDGMYVCVLIKGPPIFTLRLGRVRQTVFRNRAYTGPSRVPATTAAAAAGEGRRRPLPPRQTRRRPPPSSAAPLNADELYDARLLRYVVRYSSARPHPDRYLHIGALLPSSVIEPEQADTSSMAGESTQMEEHSTESRGNGRSDPNKVAAAVFLETLDQNPFGVVVPPGTSEAAKKNMVSGHNSGA